MVFEAGQRYAGVSYELVNDDVLEGSETATLGFAPGGAPAELLANMAVLGLATTVSVTVDGKDRDDVIDGGIGSNFLTGGEGRQTPAYDILRPGGAVTAEQ